MNINESTTGRSAAVKVDGRSFNVHYREVGSGDRGVFFVHRAGAGAGGWSNFSCNLEPFAERGWRVIAPDCLGFNKSDLIVADRSLASLNVDTVGGLMEVLGLQRVDLVGNFLGGASYIAFALQYTGALDRMVLMDPRAGAEPVPTAANGRHQSADAALPRAQPGGAEAHASGVRASPYTSV